MVQVHPGAHMKIPESIDAKSQAQYCLACWSKNISRVFKDSRFYFQCIDCGQLSERRLSVDQAINYWLDDERNFWHESVGVVVVYDNKILTQLRQIYPFAYALPAGHLDKGEEPMTAATRELWEETGIVTEALELIRGDFDMTGDSCSGGSDHHRWHLYRLKLEKLPELKISEEASKFEWMSLDDLRQCDNATYPLKFFVETIGEELLK